MTRQALSAFLNERSDLSPEMALRIEVALGPKAELLGLSVRRLDELMADLDEEARAETVVDG